MKKAIWALVFLVPSVVLAQADPERGGRSRSSLAKLRLTPEGRRYQRATFDAIRDINEGVKSLGPWQKQSKLIVNATNRVFQRNGWTTDTDRFAMQLSTDVATIPPWDYTGRFNKFATLIAKRYRLDKTQELTFRAQMMWESFDFFMNHAPALIEQGRDIVETRRQGRPFTADQIARWAGGSLPMVADWHERLSRISEKMLGRLRPDQIGLVEKDLRHWNRRLDDVGELLARWEQGGWTPHDWGLENHPDYRPKNIRKPPTRRNPDAAGGAGPDDEARDALFELAQDESRWDKYVRDFIARYKLDAAQQTTALDILAQLKATASQFRQSRADVLAKRGQLIAQTEDAQEKARFVKQRENVLARIRALFDQLKTRLEPLPTTSQRRAAESGE